MLSARTPQSHERQGAMTTLMRAAVPRASGAKALRVGLVIAGRVVDERLVKDGVVTVGGTEEATFVVPGIDRTCRVFVARGGAFSLHLASWMRGRIAEDGETRDVHPSHEAVVLAPGARGRVEVADAVLLFHVVDAPLAPTRPQLPLAATRRLFDGVDWPLTILVGLSFLVHFGIVGSLYSDWSDPVLDERVTLQALVELSPSAPVAPIEEARPEPARAARDEATPRAEAAPPRSTSGGSAHTTRRTAQDPTAGLVEAAERMRLGLLATTAEGSPVAEALRRSQIPPVSLDRSDGAVAPDRELTLHAGGVVDPSARRIDLTETLAVHKEASDGAGPIADTPGPRVSVDASPLPGVVPVTGAERTIAALRPAFRRCYERGLQKDPSMAGDVTVRAKIRATGEVDAVSVTGNHGLSSDVAQCIAHKIELAQFDPQKSGGATLDVPVKFVRQR